MPSFIVPEQGGGHLIGSSPGIYRLEDRRLGAQIVALPQPAHNRTNDATVDDAGRLWFGTMDDAEERATGAVWCWDRGTLTHAGGDAFVTNGPAIRRSGDAVYHVDSGQRSIWRFGLNTQGCFRDGHLLIQLDEDDGYPDGIVVDSKGCLWVALWNGWGVRRYAPDGTLLLHGDSRVPA